MLGSCNEEGGLVWVDVEVWVGMCVNTGVGVGGVKVVRGREG